MITNHWGKWVDSEEPVTGVISNNNLAWEWIEDECLTCQEMWEEIENNPDLDEEEKQVELDSCECDPCHTKIFGDWILDTKTNQYEPDTTNGEYAAIESESVTQIVWSKYTKRGALCSPCYPGQVDLDSEGDFLGYTLPDELINHE